MDPRALFQKFVTNADRALAQIHRNRYVAAVRQER
jgi:hypothetical protein